MASAIESALDAVVDYANNDAYGYVLQGSDYGKGTDCAGLVRYYVAAMEGVGTSKVPELDTWDMRSILLKRGWTCQQFAKSRLRRGDVLLRERSDGTGHTVIWLGDNQIVGAEGDKDGRQGDSSGREICVKSYYKYEYNWILRPPSKYQSDSLEGTVYTGTGFGGTYRLNCDWLNCYDEPDDSSHAGAHYERGVGDQSVILDDWYKIAGGFVWGRYTSRSGTVRYIKVGPYTGKAESDDYLIKIS